MRNITVAGLVFAALLSFTACDDGGTTPTDGRSPLETLQAVGSAFGNRDTTALDVLLTSDFRFYFDENDVGSEVNGYTIPASWGRAIFLTALGNMFESVYSVSFSFDESDVGEPRKGDTTYETGDVDVSFTVMVDYVNGFAATGPLTFRFTLDTADRADFWSLDNIRDYTSSAVLERMWSFGTILAAYYAGSDGGEWMPAEALEALEESFNGRDIGLFKDVLAPDVVFHFDPHDVGGSVGDYIIPESWGYGDLTSAVGNMFDAAYSIEFMVSTVNVGDPGEGAEGFKANNVLIDLLVLVEPTYGYGAHGLCDYEFVNAGFGLSNDWVITDWWDKTASYGTYGSPSPSSLGRILAAFK
jgi:hypothetical protein